MAAGAPFGLKLAGLHAMDSLRIEKGYRHWGHDIGDEDSPVEAGLMFAVKLGKPFIGRDAVGRRLETPQARRMLQFALQDPTLLLYGNEPIWFGERIVGRVTSGAYGHTLGAAIGLGYVETSELDGLEIEVAGRRVAARASVQPMYDPMGARIRL